MAALTTSVPAVGLKGRVALITGASSGIGAATARAFGRAGANLVLNGRNAGRLKAVADGLVKDFGVQVATLVGDAALESTQRALVDLALSRFGALHIAFNNAASQARGGVSDVTSADLHALIDMNVKGLVFALQIQLAAIAKSSTKDNWGVILNTSSAVSERVKGGLEGFAIYSATKGLMDTLTKFAALEAGNRYVRVNSINTGAVATPGSVGLFGGREAYDKTVPQYILGGITPQTPDELAEFILFVADSRTGRFFNGSNLLIDGGMAIM